ncbi:MAG: YqjD family protein [Steroidobacteraceae bacterium]
MSTPVTTAKLMEDLKVLARDAEALLQVTASQTGERVDAVRARANESLQQAKVRLASAQDQVMQTARDATEAAETHIKANPWQSVGFAASLGLVIGMLLRRRD